MNLEKPIIIVGTGRCGSTLLHRVMARHEDLGWLSPYNEVFPTQHWLSVFSNLYRSYMFSLNVKHLRFFPKPFEAYRFWEHYLPGFSRRNRPQTEDDVPSAAIQPVRQAISRILNYQGTKRFLVKVTGWSRIAYFNRLFPDALFVFLNREPRAVVSSWIQAGWLDVTSGLDSPAWQWGEVPSLYYHLWKELGAKPILSAAVKIQLDLDDIRRNMVQFQERCYEMQYESLVTQPQNSLKALLQFCQLPWTDKFEKQVKSLTFYNPANKWKKYLTEEDGNLILEFFSRATQSAA
jgi:hypothetical protein